MGGLFCYKVGYMIKNVIPSTLVFIGIVTAIWAILIVAVSSMMGTSSARHVPVLLQLGPLMPLLVGRIGARHFANRFKRELLPSERIGLALFGIIGITFVALLAEAGVIYALYGVDEGKSYAEILIQPPATRYSITTAFGLTFTTAAMLAAAFTTLISMPAQIMLRTRRLSAD